MIGRRLITHTLAYFAAALLPAAAAAATPEQVANDFHPVFRSTVGDKNIVGAAYVVVTPDEIIRIGTAGHTDTRRRQAINENTVFRVASVSKTFAAGLSGVLVAEGEFGWDDRVIDYIPDFRVDGDASRVRIENLLGQSTGLIPHAYDNLIEDGLTLDRIQKQFAKLPYICEPGACYTYQNSVFSLIGPVIEKTTGRSYAEAMYEKIFRPLDMRDSSVGYEPFVGNPNHARPHVKTKSGWKTVAVKPHYYRVAPAAGVNASAADMGKWLTAQMGGQPDVLDPEVVDQLTEPRVRTPRDKRRKHWRELLSDAHYGLGWRIYRLGENEIAYHSGWVSGYRADIAWSESHGVGIAVLTNVEGNGISKLTTTFWKMALEALPENYAKKATTGISPIAAGPH